MCSHNLNFALKLFEMTMVENLPHFIPFFKIMVSSFSILTFTCLNKMGCGTQTSSYFTSSPSFEISCSSSHSILGGSVLSLPYTSSIGYLHQYCLSKLLLNCFTQNHLLTPISVFSDVQPMPPMFTPLTNLITMPCHLLGI